MHRLQSMFINRDERLEDESHRACARRSLRGVTGRGGGIKRPDRRLDLDTQSAAIARPRALDDAIRQTDASERKTD